MTTTSIDRLDILIDAGGFRPATDINRAFTVAVNENPVSFDTAPNFCHFALPT